MCIIGCVPFRAGNNFFREIEKGINLSAEKYGIKTRIINVPFDANESKIAEVINKLLSPFEHYIYQGLLMQVQGPHISYTQFSKKLEAYIVKHKLNLRLQTKFVEDKKKVQFIAAYSKIDNIKSYLCGDDKWLKFPYWFVTKKLDELNSKSFDDSLVIIEAKKLEDVKNIEDIMKRGKSPCIFCSDKVYQESRVHFNKGIPEYTWCIR